MYSKVLQHPNNSTTCVEWQPFRRPENATTTLSVESRITPSYPTSYSALQKLASILHFKKPVLGACRICTSIASFSCWVLTRAWTALACLHSSRNYRNSRTDVLSAKIFPDHTSSFLSSYSFHKQQRAASTSCFGHDLVSCSPHLNISVTSSFILCILNRSQHPLVFSH